MSTQIPKKRAILFILIPLNVHEIQTQKFSYRLCLPCFSSGRTYLLPPTIYAGGKILVVFVESCSSESLEVNEVANRSRLVRLTAAVYTTAGTTHDFDKGVILFAPLYHFKKLLCIGCAGCNSNLNINTCNIIRCFLDTFCTANSLEFELFGVGACEPVNCSSESSFHNAACSTEDSTCTGAETHR